MDKENKMWISGLEGGKRTKEEAGMREMRDEMECVNGRMDNGGWDER